MDKILFEGYVVTLQGLVWVRIVQHYDAFEPVLEAHGKVVKAIVES